MNLLSPDRWAEADTLFDAALQRPRDERTAFLRATCGHDPDLYHAVTALLETDDAAERALGESATKFAARLLEDLGEESEADLAEGTRVGPYRIVREIGRGGMGTVYLAERADETFEKQVALKLVKRGMDTDEVLRRFRFERQVLAGLDHPNIARLLDAGAAEDGRPYLVMELAEGESITAYSTKNALALNAQLALFEQVCEAVAYAHRHLVVHRDLKPSNILVSDTGDVKLLDFGIAKLLESDDEASETPRRGVSTRPEQRLLTPEYAAPEQRTGQSVTTATDVYALGVILFELLTGQRPDTTPRPPSAVVTDSLPRVSGDRLRRRLRGDLDTLTLTALHTDPARRYSSADALLDDLRRLRTGLPLHAQPDRLGYRTRKFVGRHRWGVGVTAFGVLVLMAFTVMLAAQQRQTSRALEDAEATADFLESLFAAADPYAAERLDTLRVRDLLSIGAARVETELAEQPLVRARLLQVIGATFLRTGHFAEAEPLLREAVALLASAAPERRLDALVPLVSVLRHLDAHAEAEQFAREALGLLPEGADPDAQAAAEIELALVLRGLDRHDEAEPLHRMALGRLRAIHGDDHPAVLDAETRLGGSLLEMGRLDEAETHYRAVLERMRRLDGGPRVRHHVVLDPLAFLLRVAGRADEAERLSAQSVALAREAVPGTSRLASSLMIHAGALVQLGRDDEAEALLIEALALSSRRPIDRAIALGTLATLRQNRGELEGAEDAQRQVLMLLREADGQDELITAHSTIKLGVILRQQRRFAEAEQVLLDAHGVLARDSFGHDPHAEQAVTELVTLYEEWGRPTEAARWRAETSSGTE